MKKLAFALMFALPMLFAACSDDNEGGGSANGDKNGITEFNAPVQEWGANQQKVQDKVSDVYVLDLNLSDEYTLFYTYKDSKDANLLPWYVYDFEDNMLADAGYVVNYDSKDEFEKWLNKHYTDQGYYVDDPEDEDDLGYRVYTDTKKVEDAKTLIFYQPYLDELNGEDFMALMGVWVPADEETRAADKIAAGAAHLEKVRESVKKAL